jgi:ADP-glucose pyrophosphorylase
MEDIVPGSVGHVYERFDLLVIVKHMVKCVHSRTISHIVVTAQYQYHILFTIMIKSWQFFNNMAYNGLQHVNTKANPKM